jgi:quinol monooxygenase YgiN
VFGLVVRFELAQGHEEAFDRLVSETIQKMETNEPRTLVYLAHSLPGSARARLFYELYSDESAFDAHERSPHVRRFLAERSNHLMK